MGIGDMDDWDEDEIRAMRHTQRALVLPVLQHTLLHLLGDPAASRKLRAFQRRSVGMKADARDEALSPLTENARAYDSFIATLKAHGLATVSIPVNNVPTPYNVIEKSGELAAQIEPDPEAETNPRILAGMKALSVAYTELGTQLAKKGATEAAVYAQEVVKAVAAYRAEIDFDPERGK